MSELDRQTILSHLKPEQPVYLATCEDCQPYVRPMTLIFYNNHFYFATGTTDAKNRQIKSNPRVEICLPIKEETGNGYVRVMGFLNLIDDNSIRQEIFDKFKFISNYFNDSFDPGYTLYQMVWQKVDYIKPGEEKAVTLIW